MRTGTTTFQHFIALLNLNIIYKPKKARTENITAERSYYSLFKKNLYEDRYEIYNNKDNYNNLENSFKDYLKIFFNNQKRISVLSDEGFLGGINNPLGFKNLYIVKKTIEKIEKELNIKIIIKFIITIRNQHDLVNSIYYSQSLGEKFSQFTSLEDLYKKIIQSEDYKNLFDYTLLIKEIEKIFNSEILILPLELLVKDKEKYIDKLCKFMDFSTKCKNVIRENLVHLNKNYIMEGGRKKYFLIRSTFNRKYYLASLIHNWLKKIKIYKKNFRNSNLLTNIYRIILPKKKRILVDNKVDTKIESFQKEIKNLYTKSNLELERKMNINLRDLDYY